MEVTHAKRRLGLALGSGLALFVAFFASAQEEGIGGLEAAAILQKLGAKMEKGVSAKLLADYGQHFKRVDADGDGRHSKEEYIDNGGYLSPQARRGIFNAADGDGDGFVTEAEYTLNRIITDEAKSIVQAMDDDRDGVVQRAEFIKHAEKKLSDAELAGKVFAALDTSGNGEIVVPEYLRVWGQWSRTGGEAPEKRLASGGAPIAELPKIHVRNEEELHEALESAHRLAELGAHYEAARVFAAIAVQREEIDAGREALAWLGEFGLTIESVRRGTAAQISAALAEKLKPRDGDWDDDNGAPEIHFSNLVSLGLFADAAALLEASQDSDRWGEVLEHYRIPRELLKRRARDEIVDRLGEGIAESRLRLRVDSLWVLDPKAAEIAHELLRHFDPEFEDHDEEEESDRDDSPERRAEVLQEVVRLARGLADDRLEIALTLADLIADLAPEALPGDLEELRKPRERKAPASKASERKPGDIFEEKGVREYHLELSGEAIASLQEKPKEYVRGIFREGENTYENVGVRLKGSWGSFRALDGQSKAGFTIKFNQFDSEQRFHGLRRIVLNNAVQDASYLHEYVGYGIFRDAGVPAPRVTFANLHVDGELFGLYVQVEAVTKDLLRRWFKNPKGNLYEGPGDVFQWEELDLDSNQEKDDRADLRQLAKAIEDADDEDPWATLGNHVDADAFARFYAIEQIIGHWDGYTQTNNYRIYRDPTAKKFHFIPHGADQIFEDAGASTFRPQAGILGRALLMTGPGKKRYRDVMRALLDGVWDETAVRARIAEVYLLVRSEVGKATQMGDHDLGAFDHQVRDMLRFIALRRFAVEAHLAQNDTARTWRDRPFGEDGLPSVFRRSRLGW